MTSMWQAVDF